MKPLVCIVGAKGNMGRRYSAICWHSKIAYKGVDKGDPLPTVADGVTHYILATPTELHTESLVDVTIANSDPVSILVEKPIDTRDNFERGVKAAMLAESWGHTVYMVNNYAYYSQGITEGEGDTHYDYYNSGKDDIAPDCIQLIHLAKSGIGYLRNLNPVWDCMINGRQLNRELIDLCYIKMIKDFVSDGELYGRLWGIEDIKTAHEKVLLYETNSDRHPSKKHLH
jgi:hypothetical protein